MVGILNVIKCYWGAEPEVITKVGYSDGLYSIIENDSIDTHYEDTWGIDETGFFFKVFNREAKNGQMGERGWRCVKVRDVPVPVVAILERERYNFFSGKKNVEI